MGTPHTAAEPAKPRPRLILSRRGLLLVAAAAAPWVLVARMAHRQDPAPAAIGAPAPRAAAASGQLCRPGPWGRLSAVDLDLEIPEEYIPAGWADTLTSVWHFVGMKEPEVSALLLGSGLPDPQYRALDDRRRWQVSDAGVDVTPPDDVLLAMPSEAREHIYAALAPLPGNGTQENPYSFLPGQLAARFANAGLKPATIAMVERLLYRRGAVELLSDMFAAVNATPQREEKLALIKAVSRKPGLLLSLHVDAGSDIAALAAYWGKGGRAQSLRPLLEGLARQPGGGDIDVINLLPDFARRRLNIFPIPGANDDVRLQDCYWSALNFFSEGDLADPPGMGTLNDLLRRDYHQLPGEPVFGDLLFLVLPSGESIHAAIYVADGIVFTKNGGYIDQPWLLMRLDDVAMGYGATRVRQEPLSVMAWRRRDI